MRPVIKSIRYSSPNVPLEVTHWREAKEELTNEMGTFCSYCGKYNNRSALHVEHIYGKKCIDDAGDLKYSHLQNRWANFLLACVNCNSIKKNKDIAISNPYLPHLNNLLHFIEILRGGIIRIKPGVTGIDKERTKAFIDLIGLDRIPGHPGYSNKDDRWDSRMKVADIAERQRFKYDQPVPATDIETIIDLAATTGYFNIWYTTFYAFEEVKHALINGIAFPGTDPQSFDPHNHYSTLPRP
jgi:hypothetical protein